MAALSGLDTLLASTEIPNERWDISAYNTPTNYRRLMEQR